MMQKELPETFRQLTERQEALCFVREGIWDVRV